MTDRLVQSSGVRPADTALLKLNFLISAYNTAQRMIWFSDQKASFIVIYYGILLSMLGTRVERLLTFFRAPGAAVPPRAALVCLGLAFVATMGYALVYTLRTVLPTYVAPVEVRDYRRLYWCHDILAKDVETYLESLRDLDGDFPAQGDDPRAVLGRHHRTAQVPSGDPGPARGPGQFRRVGAGLRLHLLRVSPALRARRIGAPGGRPQASPPTA